MAVINWNFQVNSQHICTIDLSEKLDLIRKLKKDNTGENIGSIIEAKCKDNSDWLKETLFINVDVSSNK